MLEDLEQVPGAARWRLVSVQALHRFYGRDNQTVIASWMTRQDRELAISDNVEYVNRVMDHVLSSPNPVNPVNPLNQLNPLNPLSLVFAGFSQGVATAYRAALLGRHHAAGIIALGGDLPPEFKASAPREWPRVLIGAGSRDIWYTDTKVRSDEAALAAQRAPYEVVRFDGGHEWSPVFLAAAGYFLAALSRSTPEVDPGG